MALTSEIRSRTPFILFGIIVGLIAGFVLNYLWYLFLAFVLDWRDSAPEWYCQIQGTGMTGIFVGVVVGLSGREPGGVWVGEAAGEGVIC
jgi:uncharacterized membrane protein